MASENEAPLLSGSASILCVDVGNTHVHHGHVTPRGIHAAKLVPTHELTDSQPFQDFLRQWENRVESLAFCSVVPGATTALHALLKKLEWSRPIFQLTAQTCPIPIAYPRPQEIGGDRLASAVGAYYLFGPPAVVVDMGTATTLDIISQRGYEGGVIAPGLGIMTRYLHEQTALLPALDPTDLAVSSGIGKTTVDAMKVGCAVGFEGMIRALVNRVQAELEQSTAEPVKRIITGDSAGLLPRSFLSSAEFHADLTLIGLALASERHLRPAPTPTGSQTV